MIQKAFAVMPGQKGTKKEVFATIERLFGLKLEKSGSTYKTLSQALSKYFQKSPQEFQLSQQTI
jgi:nitrate reductase assembly molybdenum cofactor insertion protein NarJ